MLFDGCCACGYGGSEALKFLFYFRFGRLHIWLFLLRIRTVSFLLEWFLGTVHGLLIVSGRRFINVAKFSHYVISHFIHWLDVWGWYWRYHFWGLHLLLLVVISLQIDLGFACVEIFSQIRVIQVFEGFTFFRGLQSIRKLSCLFLWRTSKILSE